MGFFNDLTSGLTSFLSGGGLFGGLLSSGLGAISSGMSNSAAKKMMREQNEFNAKEAQKQRDWQSQEWEKQFGMQTNEWYNQFDVQSKEWTRQFDYQNAANYDTWVKQQNFTNEYNSPQAQVQRLNAAGMNASAVLGNGQAAGLSNASPLASTSPSQPSPSVPTGGAVSGAAASAGGMPEMKSFGDFVQAFSSASLNNAQAKEVVDMLAGKVRHQGLENDLMESELKLKAIELDWKPKFKRKEYKMLTQRLNEAKANTALIMATTDKTFGEAAGQVFQNILLEYSAKLKGEELNMFVDSYSLMLGILKQKYKNLQSEGNLTDERAKSQASERNRNNAVASYFWESAATTRELRKAQVSLTEYQSMLADYQAQIASNDVWISDRTKFAAANTILEGSRQAGILSQQMEAQLKRMIIDNNYAEAEHIIGIMSDVVSSVVNVSTAGSMRLNALSNQQKVQIQQRIAEELKKPKFMHESNSRGFDVTRTWWTE